MKNPLANKLAATVIGALTYAAATVALLPPQKFRPAQPSSPAAATAPLNRTGPSWNFSNPELDQMLAELRRAREAVAEREQQLNEWAIRLQGERDAINQVTQSVHRLQSEFDHLVLRVRDEEAANLKKLAKLYATMSPDGAVGILRELPDDTIVKIFTFMKEAETAPVLESFSKLGLEEAKRAATLSERLRMAMFRSPTNSVPKP